jgi:hypothetical protein
MEDGKARGVAISGTCIVRGVVALPVSPSCGPVASVVQVTRLNSGGGETARRQYSVSR